MQAETKVYPKNYSGWLDLSGCDLNGITLPKSVTGSLDLRDCDLKGITLPESVGGSLHLSGCDLKGIALPPGARVIKWGPEFDPKKD